MNEIKIEIASNELDAIATVSEEAEMIKMISDQMCKEIDQEIIDLLNAK